MNRAEVAKLVAKTAEQARRQGIAIGIALAERAARETPVLRRLLKVVRP